jgi:hypothetical protein
MTYGDTILPVNYRNKINDLRFTAYWYIVLVGVVRCVAHPPLVHNSRGVWEGVGRWVGGSVY